MRTVILATAALAAFTVSANAEIWCEERLGCWETGRQIRLVHHRTERTVPTRDGRGTMTLLGTGVVNDTPSQRISGTTSTVRYPNGRRR
jgi:hypothetical protein